MGHIVLGSPGIDRFHLHERLLRALRQRGHHVAVLCVDPVAETFWRHQDDDVVRSRPPLAQACSVPLAELPRRERADARMHLAAPAGGLLEWFAEQRPDLVLLHQDRGPQAKRVQQVARAAGCRVLWTGEGLLPHTLQVDERGLDGEASCAQRAAAEFRVVRGEPALLQACLANALARTQPFGLPRAEVHVPPLRERLRDLLPTWRQLGVAHAIAGVCAWRRAIVPRARREAAWRLPPAPFIAVMLQRRDDPRVGLDGGEAPSAAALVHHAAAAARQLGADVKVVVVTADRAPSRTFAGHPAVPAMAAAEAAATALATVTINHPLASVALLAGTPVLHTGQALYGVAGVATRTRAEALAEVLPRALCHDYPTLRQRFLSWVFGHGHVWCSATHPDWNGMQGLVSAIEARLAEPAAALPSLRYRSGPAWPLAAEARPS